MMQRTRRGLLLLFVPAFLSLLLVSVAAHAGDWTGQSLTQGDSFYGVWGGSVSDVFAVGSDGLILHYSGSAWTAMNSGTTNNLSGVWGGSANDVFGVGSDGVILHYNGSVWAPMNSGTTNLLAAVWGSSGNDVFAAGINGTVLHFNGNAWTAMTSTTTNDLHGVWGSSASGVFVVGASGTVLHYNGSAWTAMAADTTDDLHSVRGISENDVFSVGSGGLLHYDGSAWTAMASGMTGQSQRRRQRGRPAPTIWYIGIGASQASIHSNYSAIGSKSAGGYALLAGVEFAETWSVEMFVSAGHHIATGPTEKINYPPDTAEYSVVAFNLRKSIWSLEENGWTPWIAVGFGIGQVYWDTYFYELTGSGLAFSGGVDLQIGTSPAVIRAQIMAHSFSATDTYDYGPYDVSARVLSALLVYRFR